MTAQCIRSSRLRADYARCVNGFFLGGRGVKIMGQHQTAFCLVSAYQVFPKPRNFKCKKILQSPWRSAGGVQDVPPDQLSANEGRQLRGETDG